MTSVRRIKFLLSRDDYYHQRGYWVIANALRNGGFEVILGGIQTPSEIVETALQEDVDIIGYRLMDASSKVMIPILAAKMKANGIGRLPIVVGGIVPERDEKFLKELGVREIFHPFTPLDYIVERCYSLTEEYRRIQELEQEGLEHTKNVIASDESQGS
jgi:methylmalonyl-CoA mutase C-terminal domain/subunit